MAETSVTPTIYTKKSLNFLIFLFLLILKGLFIKIAIHLILVVELNQAPRLKLYQINFLKKVDL